MTTYTVTVYYADLDSCGSCALPDFEKENIYADSDEEAIEKVQRMLGTIASQLAEAGGYEPWDFIYAVIWDDSGLVVDCLPRFLQFEEEEEEEE